MVNLSNGSTIQQIRLRIADVKGFFLSFETGTVGSLVTGSIEPVSVSVAATVSVPVSEPVRGPGSGVRGPASGCFVASE